jgi:hypothetical protein
MMQQDEVGDNYKLQFADTPDSFMPVTGYVKVYERPTIKESSP